MEDTKTFQEFLPDWKIDYKTKSAQHKTGLSIAYDSTNEDGSLRLAYSGMMTWNKSVYAVLKDVEKVEEFRALLTHQFVEIYQKKMCAEQNIIQNIKQGNSY